jgi:hypothetical protein
MMAKTSFKNARKIGINTRICEANLRVTLFQSGTFSQSIIYFTAISCWNVLNVMTLFMLTLFIEGVNDIDVRFSFDKLHNGQHLFGGSTRNS